MSDDKKRTYKFKVTLFGAGNVGKTSLILRFIKESFSNDLKKTIGTNFLIKDVVVNDINVRLLVWDIGGQSSFSSMRAVYFKGSNACIGVYDITSPESLLKIPGWLSSIKKSVGDIPMILLGNKYDLAPDEQRVSEKDALDLCSRLGCTHRFTSAKTGDGVEESFMELAKKCIEIAQKFENPSQTE